MGRRRMTLNALFSTAPNSWGTAGLETSIRPSKCNQMTDLGRYRPASQFMASPAAGCRLEYRVRFLRRFGTRT
jgi:hypothetical protein